MKASELSSFPRRRIVWCALPLGLVALINFMDSSSSLFEGFRLPKVTVADRKHRQEQKPQPPASLIFDYPYYNETGKQISSLISNNTFYGVHARAYQKWQQQGEIPCTSTTPSGQFLYIKLLKVGGSTGTGVHARIARHRAEQMNITFESCVGPLGHTQAHQVVRRNQHKDSFLWTTLRDPTTYVLKVQCCLMIYFVSPQPVSLLYRPNQSNC